MGHAYIEDREPRKSIGGLISEELYWEYKRVQANRQESATTALENAIRLYVDLDVVEEKK